MTDSNLDRIADATAGVDAMQDAALERAIVGDVDAAAHLAFAGALEAARPVPDGGDPLLLGSLLAVAIETRHGGAIRVDGLHESPPLSLSSFEPDGRRRPVVEGALLALERFDVSVETVASLATLSVAELETERRRS
ncbi:hypothetical protein ACFO0N_14325 [Halobium salinum]|uniref:Uncharacterized protein n=1 Tax=Halobium salinum TaxID=1364940 RepID=A0ABD5PFA3_9EURY|nr:hypothetical protein [Halobium salinum]